VFISGGNLHLTNRFCEVVLGPTTIFKTVSEPSPRSVRPPAFKFPLSGHPPFIFTLHMFIPGHEGGVLLKSPTSHKKLPENVFISGDNYN